MKIKTKLQVISILPLAAFVAVMTVQVVMSVKIERSRAKEDVSATISREVSDLITLTYEYGITRGKRAQIQWSDQHTALAARLNKTAVLFAMPDEKKSLDDMRLKHKDASRRFSELIAYDKEVRRDEKPYGIRDNMINSLLLELQEILPRADSLHTRSR